MSSSGARAAGTDGSDWKHREKVARQYVVSVKFKNAIKRTILYHGMFGATMVGAALVCGINTLYMWQALWILAAPSCLLGFRGIMKNNISMLSYYRILLLFLSVPSVVWGIGATMGYLPHKPIYPILDLPKPPQYMMPVNNWATYFLGGTTLLSHLFTLVCISKLTAAWNTTSRKSKSQ